MQYARICLVSCFEFEQCLFLDEFTVTFLSSVIEKKLELKRGTVVFLFDTEKGVRLYSFAAFFKSILFIYST